MSLEESVHNYCFQGTVTDGVITISGYSGITGTYLVQDCLTGMLVVAKEDVIGYVKGNTAWRDGGMLITLGYSNLSLSGLIDFQFVFPIGRLSFSQAGIKTEARPVLSYTETVPIELFATPPLPSEYTGTIFVRTAPTCGSDSLTYTSKIRGGQQWESL